MRSSPSARWFAATPIILKSSPTNPRAASSTSQLNTGVPIANAILTMDTEEQGHKRMAEKGRDAARAAIEMANLLKRL